MRDPTSDESTVFAGPPNPGRYAIDVGPFKVPAATFELPPGAGNELMSGSPDPMLEWRSSKLTEGRKSKDPDDWDVSRRPIGAPGASLNLDELLAEDCLEWSSWEALGALFRCVAWEIDKPLCASLELSATWLGPLKDVCFTYRFDGEACREPGGCKALCSLNDDCLLRVAGVGNGSGLMLDRGVGSAGLEDIEVLCCLLDALPSPMPPVSNDDTG